MPYDDRTAQETFRRINKDARRAYCLGDVELDDIIDTELDAGDERRVRKLLAAWGETQGIEAPKAEASEDEQCA